MSTKKRSKKKTKQDVIEAAGVLLWKYDNGSLLLALVHRSRYDDWTLPKGCREKGESWEETAYREVREETNCRVALKEFAGCTCYSVNNVPKVVLFWHLELLKERTFRENEETDRLIWLSKDEALDKVSYTNERDLINKYWQI